MNERVEVHVVEPDEVFRRILMRTLEDGNDAEQLGVHGYSDGYDFMERYSYGEARCIYIINDILPKKNGIELVQHIRRTDIEGVIYFMTRSNTEEEMVYALNMGVDSYFIKPFNLRVFQARINRLVNRGENLWV
ncbi:response regulator transcription factor [Salinicoccus sp. ID82-1]|uniref:response regulator transcription factor n=1 Tax=Salinicoccus sp. ID82-1 TaxID=2820269 RepID=UPI001F0007A3|nr:response regulator [Salinicoccus sp. ID82-1]MCG1010315.1 response regulator transcription factor [Salinicoccus sp. ID82-1]